MPTLEIPPPSWGDFLEGFSHRHHGWRVDLLVRDDDGSGSELIAADAPLREIALEPPDEVDISFGGGERPLTKVLRGVHRVLLDTTPDGADRELAVEGDYGAETVVRIRVPASPEIVDGWV